MKKKGFKKLLTPVGARKIPRPPSLQQTGKFALKVSGGEEGEGSTPGKWLEERVGTDAANLNSALGHRYLDDRCCM